MLEKIFEKKCKKIVFYINTNIVSKKWGGGKRVKQFCRQHPNSASNKCWEKIVGRKYENTFFIFKLISWPKKGGENARNNFASNTRIVWAINVGKKIVRKRREKTFFIFTRISLQKMQGKKRAKQFFQKHTNSASKIVGKKIVGQSAKKLFLYSHDYRDQKMWEKIRVKRLTQNHTNNARKKCRKKIVWKKCKKNVFYIYTNIVTQKGGKNARNKFSRNTRIVRAKNVGKKIVGIMGRKVF